MTKTVEKYGGMLSIFKLMDYFVIIHELNKLEGGGGGLADQPRPTLGGHLPSLRTQQSIPPGGYAAPTLRFSFKDLKTRKQPEALCCTKKGSNGWLVDWLRVYGLYHRNKQP